MYEVLKPFNLVNRRLQVGSTITEVDDLTPFTLEERTKSGFLKKPIDPATPAKSPKRETGLTEPPVVE